MKERHVSLSVSREQIGGVAADLWTKRGRRDVRPSDDLLQRHRGLHQPVGREHPSGGGRSAERPLHVLRFHHRELRRLQGTSIDRCANGFPL